MSIKAILFDMDGVLIEAKDWHFDALNDALGLFGQHISYDEHLAVFDGLPTRKKLEILTRTRGLSPRLHDFINHYKQRRTMEMIYTRCRPLFHHQYALARLNREGYGIAVCSNSIRSTVEAMMERSGLLERLDFFLSNEDVAKPKPAPDIYLLGAARFELAPSECLIVEDNEHGIEAANASGGHLLQVASVYDVTYARIRKRIEQIEQTEHGA
jgi:HAD superfamily hydrolase (TIGR01509 family)